MLWQNTGINQWMTVLHSQFSVMFLLVSICLDMWNKINYKKFMLIFSSSIQKKFITDYWIAFGAWLLAHTCGYGRLDWLIDASLSSFHKKATVALSFGRIRTRLGVDIFQVFRLTFDFFPHKFAACSKPPSRDNHCKASYPRTQQRDQGADWTHDHAIRVGLKIIVKRRKNDAFTLLATLPTL